MTDPKPCAVVFCAQHEKVLAFYRDALGLPVVHHEDSHSVLDASGLLLVVHPLPDTVLCAPEPVTRRWDCTLKLMFPVASIAEARARAEDARRRDRSAGRGMDLGRPPLLQGA